jgi:hypothetical protein
MHRKRPLVAVIAALALVSGFGCGHQSGDGRRNRITKRNFEKIRIGMGHQEVTKILGEPTQKGPMLPSRSSVWIWTEEDKEIVVLMDETAKVEGNGTRAMKFAANLE